MTTSNAGPSADRAAPARIIPVRDQRLGQSDRTTAALLWLIIGLVSALAALSLVPAALALRQAGDHAGAACVGSVGLALAFGAVFGVLVRMIAVDHRASFARLAGKLRRAYPCARIRLDDPPLRILGVGVVHGRRGLVAFAPERAVVIVARVPTWCATACLGAAAIGGAHLGPGAGFYSAFLFAAAATILALFSGADVHEVAYCDIDRADGSEGRVQWVQTGAAAPRLLRFRLTHPDDPGASQPWVSGEASSDLRSGARPTGRADSRS